MCTKKDQANETNCAKSGDVNVTVNKQHTSKCASNLCNDNHNVDFRIHTNIEVISNKKFKICLFVNLLVSVVCVSASFLFTYKVYKELLEVQNQVLTLNKKLLNLNDACESIKADALQMNANTQDFTIKSVTDTRTQQQSQEPPISVLSSEGHINEYNTTPDGALAAHFKGSLPEIYVKDQSLIGPWYPDDAVSRQYKFPKFHLTEGKCSIEVTESALYLIYAQVYYVTSSALNSYTIYVKSEGTSENNVIAKCSAVGPNNSHVAEISCYTSTVYSLKTNDRIFLQQTEKNRTIILRDGHSFFGLVRLNNAVRHSKQ